MLVWGRHFAADCVGTRTLPPAQQTQPSNSQFSLQRDQRQKALNGKAFTGSDRPEVQGTATRTMSIESVSVKAQESAMKIPKSVYVGRLSANTTVVSLRKHLGEEGIINISDIIDLKCRSPDQTSFCIIADDPSVEEALYDPTKWPRGTKIRPFKQKNDFKNQQQKRNPQHWKDRQGPRHRQQYSNRGPTQPKSSQVDRANNMHSPSPTPVTEPSTSAVSQPLPRTQSTASVPPLITPSDHWMSVHRQLPPPFHPVYSYPFSQNRFSPLTWLPSPYA